MRGSEEKAWTLFPQLVWSRPEPGGTWALRVKSLLCQGRKQRGQSVK